MKKAEVMQQRNHEHISLFVCLFVSLKMSIVHGWEAAFSLELRLVQVEIVGQRCATPWTSSIGCGLVDIPGDNGAYQAIELVWKE